MRYQPQSLSRGQLAKFALNVSGTRSSAGRGWDRMRRTFEEDDRSNDPNSETDSSVANSVSEYAEQEKATWTHVFTKRSATL